MPLTNCEITLQLTCCKKYSSSWYCRKSSTKFRIAETKLYVPVVTLSTQDNKKLLEQLKSGFKRTINWNRYNFGKTQAQNEYLAFWIDWSFQRVNGLFVLSYNDDDDDDGQKITSNIIFHLWKWKILMLR